MGWLIFAIGSALFASAASITQKRTLNKEHAMEYSAILAILNFAFSLVLIPKVNFNIPIIYYAVVYIGSWLGAIAFLLVAKSIRHMELSSSSPILNFGPAITAIFAWIILGEALGMLQWVGIGLLVLGAYVLEIKGSLSHILSPFKAMIKSKYYHFIIIALLLYGFSSLIDRFTLTHGVSPETMIVLIHFFIMINYLIMIHFLYGGLKDIKHGIKSSGKWIVLISAFTVTYRFLQAKAVAIAYVGLVVAIKRLSTLVSTMVGGKIYHEKNLVVKVLGCIIMLWGAVFIIL